MNMLGTKKHLTSIGIHVLLVLLTPIIFGGCKEKGDSQDVNRPSPVEQAEALLPPDRDELIDANDRIKLRILCTTSPKEGRTGDFVEFLRKHFVEVATTDYKSFQESLAVDFDVVILDYGMRRPGTPVPPISPAYSRATITIGAAGSMICNRLRLKTGYL